MARICIFGDSIVCGRHEPETGGWALMLTRFLTKTGNKEKAYELGFVGDNSSELLERFEVELKARSPKTVVINIGVNDTVSKTKNGAVRIEFESFKNNLEEMLEICKRYKVKTVFIGLAKVDEDRTCPVHYNEEVFYVNERIEKYDAEIEMFCKENKLLFIPMIDLLEVNDTIDGIHPNGQGYRKMLERVKEYLGKDGVLGEVKL